MKLRNSLTRNFFERIQGFALDVLLRIVRENDFVDTKTQLVDYVAGCPECVAHVRRELLRHRQSV